MKNIPKGTWEKNPIIETNEYGSQCIDIDTEQFGSQVSVWFDETIESEKLEAESVADLICDAGNTYNQTQLTPSEILAQRNELLKCLKKVHHTLSVHGKVDSSTDLHNLIVSLISKIEQ